MHELSGDRREEFARLLTLEFDPRLVDVWTSVFSLDIDPSDLSPAFGTFLRMAYLRGYQDALVEGERGELLRKLGAPVPPKPKAKAERKET